MQSIKSELTKGVFWIALAKYSGIFISLGISAILARQISPSAFGTMAIAAVIMAFLDIFSDMGLGVAIIQFKDLTKEQVHSLFTISIGIATVLTALLFASSTIVARFYNDPELTIIIRWLCICLFFNSMNVIPNGMMLKDKRFKVIAIRTLFFQVISGILACGAALHGWGIYALLISPVITSIGVFTYNFYTFPQRPIWPIDTDVVKKVWNYSFYQFLFSFINYFSRNADKLIIGKYFSMKDLGYYDKSYRLMQMPLQNITFVITPVLHPILSSLQTNPKELLYKNIHLVRILSQISFPLGVILYFCASPIITIIYGRNWLPAIPIFEILSLSIPFQVILSTSGSIFQAAGQTKHLFYCGLQSAICTITAFIIAAIYFHTISAMAWAWNLALLVNFLFCYWFMGHFTFQTSVIKFYKVLLPQLLNSIVTVGVILIILFLWKPTEPLIQIILIGSLTLTSTLIMGTLLRQYSIRSILSRLIHQR